MTPQHLNDIERILLLALRISSDMAATIGRLQAVVREIPTRGGYSSADRHGLPLVGIGQGEYATEWTPGNGGGK